MPDVSSSSLADAAKKLSTFFRSMPIRSSSMADSYQKIEEDIEELRKKLTMIRATLHDAENREVRDESVRLWLRELEGLAYDAEDFLEELPYDVPRLLSQGCGGTTTAPSCCTVWPRSRLDCGREMGRMVHQRTEEINSRFHGIWKNKEALQWIQSDGCGHVKPKIPARLQTTSLVKQSRIRGREDDLKKIKGFLKTDAESSHSNNMSVMAIVGMGGLGKTTLAQLAYNDGEVCKQFDLKSWTCVTEVFDVLRLTRDMLESFIGEAPPPPLQLDILQTKLREILTGKRFLLVLDDVWETEGLVDLWDSLTKPLQLGGTRGSKIIITTRSEEVSRKARAVLTHHLPCLGDKDCLQVFNQRAFEGRNLAALDPGLEAMGEEISKRCRGVPLIAKILGDQLRWLDDEQKWKEILETEIWDIDEKGVMPAGLQLSYDLLPAHLRKCFKFCSVFPKGYSFDKDQLVRMWMALDYIQSRGRRPTVDIGTEYFDQLLWRSFFQFSPNARTFTMHDLIHDLARYVSREECCSLEDGIPRGNAEAHVRHMSIICRRDFKGALTGIQLPKTLRSLVFIDNSRFHEIFAWESRHSGVSVSLNDVLTTTKYLRVLDLRDSQILNLPSSIGCLKLLRYLGLPHYINSLLPQSTTELLNLRHLISESRVVYPPGIRKLTNLETMPGFHLSPSDVCARLGELKDINNIRSLHISGINQWTSVDEAREACLENKGHLRDLHLDWGYSFSEQHNLHLDVILESLRPNPMLRRLEISCFMGESRPSWLGHPSFSKLAKVELTECGKWASLPCLGQLPSLKCLSIQSAFEVQCISREFFFGGFPRLETLRLESMPNLTSWSGVQEGECPCLQELTIGNCKRLVSFEEALNRLLPRLQVLEIYDCPSLSTWCGQRNGKLVHIPTLNVQDINPHHVKLKNVLGVQAAAEVGLRCLERLQALELEWDSVAADPEDVLENLLPHSNLEKLVIRGYTGSSFPTWLTDPSFSHLVQVTLVQCSQFEHLPPLGLLPNLQELYIKAAHTLECVGNEFLGANNQYDGKRPCAFPSLRKMEFCDLTIWEEWVGVEDGDFPALNKVTIRRCPRLKALPSLPQLTELVLGACGHLVLLTTLINLSSLCILEIHDLPHHLVGEEQEIPSVRNLTLERCSREAIVALLPCLTNLTSLRISRLPEWTRSLPLHNLLQLRELDIAICPTLVELDCFYFSSPSDTEQGLQALASLRRLSVTDCPRLHFSANERAPTALGYLAVKRCPSLKPWFDRHLSRMEHVDEIWVDGIRFQVSDSAEKGWL